MKLIALVALALLLPACSLFLPAGTNCSRSNLPIYSSCKPEPAATSRRPSTLDDTYWKLVQMGGTAVRDGQALREPHIRLDANRQQLSGSGGCNEMTGHYTFAGSDGIRFSDLASTKMACPGMELDQGIVNALEHTERWRIEGEQLQLLDMNGKLIAVFRAVRAQQK